MSPLPLVLQKPSKQLGFGKAFAQLYKSGLLPADIIEELDFGHCVQIVMRKGLPARLRDKAIAHMKETGNFNSWRRHVLRKNFPRNSPMTLLALREMSRHADTTAKRKSLARNAYEFAQYHDEAGDIAIQLNRELKKEKAQQKATAQIAASA